MSIFEDEDNLEPEINDSPIFNVPDIDLGLEDGEEPMIDEDETE